jgi:hypothetical protein
VKTFQDVLTLRAIVGASSAGGTTRDLPAMLDNLLGAKFRIVTGYAGSKEITVAVERNVQWRVRDRQIGCSRTCL